MSFATPIALALATLAVPILGLYILKVRMRRLPVSTNLFWRQIYDEKPPRSIWQNLRHILSLLAQLAFLCMLVLAIADPYLPWQMLQARRVVLVLDNSASMQATDVSPNRLSVAQTFALEFVTGLRERDEVAIVVAGDSPEVIVGMTNHIPTLRRAIESVPASDNSTQLQSAIRLGQKLVGDHPHGKVLVLTDGCSSENAEALKNPAVLQKSETKPDAKNREPEAEALAKNATSAKPAEVEFKIFGDKANNMGITQFQVRRSLTDPLGYEILASVLNASDQPARCRLELTLDDAPVDVVPLKLQAGELWKRSFEKTSIEGGTLVAKLTKFQEEMKNSNEASDQTSGDPTDKTANGTSSLNQLAIDDTAWAILPARSMQKVLLVSPGNLFLRKVFEANPLVDLTVTDQLPETWPSDSLIVLHQTVPETIPDGKVFVLDPVSDTNLWKLAGEVQDPIITQQADESPLMTHIRLDNVVVPKAAKLDFQQPVESLAGTVSGEPIYAQVKRDGGKCLVLMVNLEESDLAFRTSFPILATNALNWYSNESGQLQPSLTTGTLLNMRLAETTNTDKGLVLHSPSEQTFPVVAAEDGETCTLGPFQQVGVWELSEPIAEESDEELKPTIRRFAVNVSNERESNLVALESLVEAGEVADIGGRWFTRPIWFYLALMAGLFAGAEWFLYQRRFIS